MRIKIFIVKNQYVHLCDLHKCCNFSDKPRTTQLYLATIFATIKSMAVKSLCCHHQSTLAENYKFLFGKSKKSYTIGKFCKHYYFLYEIIGLVLLYGLWKKKLCIFPQSFTLPINLKTVLLHLQNIITQKMRDLQRKSINNLCPCTQSTNSNVQREYYFDF